MLNNTLQLLHSPIAWTLYFLCAFLMGLSKTGIQNIGSLAIPIFAFLFGARESTGIVLILLALADLMGVIYYRKKLIWSEVLKLLPMALLGLLFALIIGKYIDNRTFKIIMASCILLGIGIMLWMERVSDSQKENLSNGKWYSPVFGFIMGFSTMIGNAAGPALSVYLLSKKMDKFTFVATGAWFIMILNYIKIPLQIFVWHNVTWTGLLLNLIAIPFIILGGITGIKLLKKLPERRFKRIIQILVIISSALMFFF